MDEFKVPKLIREGFDKKETSANQTSVDAPLDVSKNVSANSLYKSPSWSTMPSNDFIYSFEVLKSGQIIETIELNSRSFYRFGRLPDNEIEMAHPTISRFHAVLQFGIKENTENNDKNSSGWYIYDLNSTHGTFLNKQRIPSNVYIPVRVGHILRFGSSTRMFILQGPLEDEEPASALSITEIRGQTQLRKVAELKIVESKQNEGINWGMQEDADEETDLAYNPYAVTINEELYINDPKRALRTFFENEGFDLEYDCSEICPGTFVCRVLLPIDDTNGRSLAAEVVHKGRKKDCVVECALAACRMLDRCGLLNKHGLDNSKRKLKFQKDDSDEDDFLDRTGDVQLKKLKKSVKDDFALTYDDLIKQEEELLGQMKNVENGISLYLEKQERFQSKSLETKQDDDVLDSFMNNLADNTTIDRTKIRKLRLEQQQLKAKYEKLLKLKRISQSCFSSQENKIDNNSGLNERRNQFYKFFIKKSKEIKKTKLKDDNLMNKVTNIEQNAESAVTSKNVESDMAHM